jgi:hypothetical protein
MRFLPVPCYSIDNLAEPVCSGAVAEALIVAATGAEDRRLCSTNKSAAQPVMNPGMHGGHLALGQPIVKAVSWALDWNAVQAAP